MNVLRSAARLLTTVGCVSILGLAAAGSASASSSVCTGTVDSPGTLAGSYSSVTVNGVCLVNGGAATVSKNLTVSPGSILLAVYADNDVTGTGTSSLSVAGNVAVGPGATLMMGCGTDLGCFDDSTGTLFSNDSVGGNLTATQPMSLIMHDDTVSGNVTESGGGGGLSCAPIEPVFPFGVYSNFENVAIGGNLTVTGLQTCWFGALRTSATNMTFSDIATFDTDGNEIDTNQVSHNLSCSGNSPAAQFGDGGGSPNTVGHQASGECGFNVLQPLMGVPTPMSVMG